jgi:hypothetical protein
MKIKEVHPLVALFAIVLLSLFVAAILFGVLYSTGIFKNQNWEFGGAAAGFIVTLLLLRGWYNEMMKGLKPAAELQSKIQELEKQNKELQKKLRQATDELSGLESIDLARVVANLFARDVVRLANGDSKALQTNFLDTRENLPIYFRKQGENWREILLHEFESETILEAKRVDGLRNWKLPPPQTSIEQVEEIASA